MSQILKTTFLRLIPIGPNGLVDETYGGYHISYEVKKLMYENVLNALILFFSICCLVL